mgnify:CR=1 FL=1
MVSRLNYRKLPVVFPYGAYILRGECKRILSASLFNSIWNSFAFISWYTESGSKTVVKSLFFERKIKHFFKYKSVKFKLVLCINRKQILQKRQMGTWIQKRQMGTCWDTLILISCESYDRLSDASFIARNIARVRTKVTCYRLEIKLQTQILRNKLC